MIYRNVALPIFMRIDEGLIDVLPDVIKEANLFFKSVAILVGNHGERLVVEREIHKQFPKTVMVNVRKAFSLPEARSLIISKRVELLLAIGGGSVNDIAKYISMETSIPLISIPTTLSNDGIASPISVISLDGETKHLGTTPPVGVVADVAILRQTPKDFLLSGLGDLMSNISASFDWDLAFEDVGEKVDLIARNIAFESAIEVLFNFSRKKYDSVYSDAFIRDLFDGLMMSAVAMIIARSSRPASGAEHNIAHALNRMGVGGLHGIHVGFASLFTLFLHRREDLVREIILLYERLGFPITFRRLGLLEETFQEAVKLAREIRERYTILNRYSAENLESKFRDLKGHFLEM